jgi:hypothetical protein
MQARNMTAVFGDERIHDDGVVAAAGMVARLDGPFLQQAKLTQEEKGWPWSEATAGAGVRRSMPRRANWQSATPAPRGGG